MHFYDFFQKFYKLYNIYGDVGNGSKELVEEQMDALIKNTKIDYTDVPKDVIDSSIKLLDYHREIQEKKDIAVLLSLEPLIKKETKKIEQILKIH
ncbi:hypothetical protein [Oceanobacillus salinisoli]|uniref:hypothetical protein n=1 Tax=Oceanobacillus salinisoli TaxID=2678611 RepID=UPI0012E29C18|nr:hypothetical protein [Oceanobacillus salinisoli]